MGIYKATFTNDEVIGAIPQEAEAATLKRISRQDGMKTLRQDSMPKLKESITAIEEARADVPPDLGGGERGARRRSGANPSLLLAQRFTASEKTLEPPSRPGLR